MMKESSVRSRGRASGRLVAPLVTMSVLAFSGCSSVDSRWGPDCVSPFHFRDQEYRLGPQPPDVRMVEPGDRVGDGANESCDQYVPGDHTVGDGSDRLTEPRPVYVFPGVPVEQAIVLITPDGRHEWVLLAAEKPDGGWDRDLRRWLNARPTG